MEVAVQLTKHDALEAHARDELGINEITQAKPLIAALASALSFLCGGVLPLLVSIFAPLKYMLIAQYGFAILFLATSAIIAARAGGSDIGKSVIRIFFWGTVAMAMTALVGYIFGVKTS
jgi:VIT1/CCC1 family predicted Fe2+/Mn2+ transporter